MQRLIDKARLCELLSIASISHGMFAYICNLPQKWCPLLVHKFDVKRHQIESLLFINMLTLSIRFSVICEAKPGNLIIWPAREAKNSWK